MKKINLEAIILIIFSAAFLWFAASNILGNSANNEYPIGYLASDSFQNYGIAEGIKNSGNYKYQPLSVAGGFKDVVGTHYPIIYHVSGLLSYTGNIETHDSLMVMIILTLLTTALVMYLIIRKFSKSAAILALPLMLLVSFGKFSSAITWGQHGAITGSLFLVALLWAFSRFELDELFFIIIFISASFFGHQPEAVLGVFFILLYFLIKFLRKELKAKDIKRIVIAGVITFAITFYYFIIFRYAWVSAGFSKLDVTTVQEFVASRAFPAVLLLKDFNPVVLIFSLIGLIMLIFLFFTKKKTSITAMLFLFLLGFTNYIGFSSRAFQQRFLWPIYISALFGIGIYFILKLAFKKSSIIYSSALFLITLIIFLIGYSGDTTASSMMDPYHWDSFKWIRENVNEDKKVYFFYQDMISQRSVYYGSSQRESYVLDVQDFIGDINEGLIKRSYKMSLSAEGGADLPYRTSLFGFGRHLPEVIERMKDRVDVCSMDYIVFDKVSRQQELANYNMIIAVKLLENDWIREVYANQVVSILENTRTGEDCINEQGINE